MKRRDFLHRMTGLAAGGMLGRSVWWPLSSRALAGQTVSSDPILVVIVLQGGNDGLNTVIPYMDPLYSGMRPTLAIPGVQALDLGDGQTGLHPSLSSLMPLWNQGKVAIIRDVGYPNMNLSHFRATDILLSGSDSDEVVSTGWLARWLEGVNPGFPNVLPPDPMALQQGFSAGLVLQGERGVTGVVVENPGTFYSLVDTNYNGGFDDTPPSTRGGDELGFVREIDEAAFQYAGVIQQASTTGSNQVLYPGTRLGSQLASVAKLIDGQMATPLYITARGGFDTHGNQPIAHAALLTEYADAVAAFLSDLEMMGRQQDVLVLTVSEFGRRPSENGSSGTDHGTSAPWVVIGSGLTGGLYGSAPDLATLDDNGNLMIQADYRSVYGTILQGWMGVDSGLTQDVLQGDFPLIPFLSLTGTPVLPPPTGTYLFAPMPNPGRGPRTIRFRLDEPSTVNLSTFDVSGRLVGVIREGHFAAGVHEARWGSDALRSGVYLVRLETSGKVQTQKLLVR